MNVIYYTFLPLKYSFTLLFRQMKIQRNLLKNERKIYLKNVTVLGKF